MAVARRAAGTTVTVAAGTTLSPAYPTNAVNDILLLSVVSTTAVTTPTSWTLLTSNTTGTTKVYLYWRRVTTVLSGTQAVTIASGNAAAEITSYSGVRLTGNPYTTAPRTALAAAAGTAVSVASGTIAGSDPANAGAKFVVAVVGNSVSATVTAEAFSGLAGLSGTEAVDTAGTPSLLVYSASATSGTASAFTATESASGIWVAAVTELVDATTAISTSVASTWNVAVLVRPKVGTLSSTFDVMPAFFDGNYGGVSVSGGQAVLPCTSAYSGLGTLSTYDLTGSAVSMQVVSQPGTGGTREFTFEMDLNASNKVSMFDSGGAFLGRVVLAGVNTQTALGTYSPTAHAWWRIRESGGTIFFEAAPDGLTWSVLGSVVNPGLNLSAMTLNVTCGYYGTETSPPAAVIDNLNVAPNALSAVATSTSTSWTTLQRMSSTDPAPYAGPAGDTTWAGMNWLVRQASENGGPMFNGAYDPANVVVNADGTLTLKLTNPTGTSPVAAEISTSKAGFGYGTYTSVVATRLDTLNKSTVFGGLFTFDANALPTHNEIDVHETSAWGGGPNQDWAVVLNHTYFVPDPGGTTTSAVGVSSTNQTADVVQTHVMTWSPTQITFDSYSGPDTTGALLRHDVVTTNIPVPAKERLHYNLWVFGGGSGSPTTAPATSVTIRSLTFAPLAGVDASAPTTWNVAAPTAPTTVVTASTATSWTARAVVTDPAATSWTVRSALATSTASTWNQASALTDTQATSWNVAAPVTSSIGSTWNAASALTDSAPTTWAVASPVSTSTATSWAQTASTGASQGASWSVLSAVNASSATSWTASTPVAASSATTWTTSATTGDNQATTWSVASAVATSASTTWSQRALVTDTADTTWSTRSAAADSVSSTWALAASIETSQVATWGVQALSGIGTSLDSTWSVATSVAASASGTWAVRSGVLTSTATTWTLSTATGTSSPTAWTVLAATLASASSTWADRSLAVASTASTWSAVGSLTVSLPTAWDVAAKGSVATDLDSTWSVRAVASTSAPTAWGARSGVGATSGTTWSLHEPVAASQATSWAQRAPVLDHSDQTWDTRTSLTVSTPVSWSTLVPLLVPTASTWNLKADLQVQATTAWADLQAVLAEQATGWVSLGGDNQRRHHGNNHETVQRWTTQTRLNAGNRTQTPSGGTSARVSPGTTATLTKE